MSFTITITYARITSITISSLSQAVVRYIIGYTDNNNVSNDMKILDKENIIVVYLTSGQPIPTQAGVATIVMQDCNNIFGGVPDIITIEGVDFNVSDLLAALQAP